MNRTINDHPRSGISLIEVMFAAGILTVGILGMAALVPLGAYELIEAQKLDQSSTAGRAAFRDLEVRGYLQPKLWVDTQMGMLIDPDPTNDFGGTPATYQQRTMNYPYLPPLVWQNYVNNIQNVMTPPPGFSTSLQFPLSTNPQLFPLSYNYSYASGSAAWPLGVNLLSSGRSYPNLPPAYLTAGACPPFPPFAATDGHVMMFDPLGIAEAANLTLLNSPPLLNGPATVPHQGSAPASWTYMQTFPYQQTYNVGAPLLPRITMLPEWPKWPVNGTFWFPTNGPLSPIPTWPVPTAISGGQTWPPNGTTNQLPAVPAPGFPPWPQPWLQTQSGLPYIQMQPRFMPLVTADRIFRSRDDLVFNPIVQANPNSDRPTLGFAYDAATGSIRLEPSYQGSYSWFAMIAPAAAQVDATAVDMVDTVTQPDPSALYNTRQFNVSVVVCQNRLFDVPPPPPIPVDFLPGEWQVPARVNPASLGGGEVTLFADPSHGANQTAWLATLKPGQWLMLSGITVAGEIRMNSGNPVFWPRFRTVANWYRIVAVDDGTPLANGNNYRNVTLNGPDWPQGFQIDDPLLPGTSAPPVNFNTLALSARYGVQFAALKQISVPAYNPSVPNINIYAYATVVEGVVGVYQKTITIDGDSPFASQ